MKILFLNKYYAPFFSHFYRNIPEAFSMDYGEHRDVMVDYHSSWVESLNNFLIQENIDSELIVVNAKRLQKKWVDENTNKSRNSMTGQKSIVMEQIKSIKPDILWVNGLFDYYGDFIKEAKEYCRKIVTWIGSPFRDNIDPVGISVLLTENPETLKPMHDSFEKVVVMHPGFDSRILDVMAGSEKEYDLVFLGSISPLHLKRIKILSYLIREGVDIKIFAYINGFSKYDRFKRSALKMFKKCNGWYDSVYDDLKLILSRNSGALFGKDMYRILGKSRSVVNIHIDVAKNHSGNMRMYETTGSGACLITEDSDNITDLFNPNEEILTYKTKESLLDLIENVENNIEKLGNIAKKGQDRTIREYSISRIYDQVRNIL